MMGEKKRETGGRGFHHPDLSASLGHFAILSCFLSSFADGVWRALEDVRRPDSYTSQWML